MATLQMTEQPSTTTQTPPRASLALAADPERALHLAPNFQPDVDLVMAEGVIAFGVKGSGKSNLLALLVEQLSRFLLPQLIFDSEGEQQHMVNLLPHGVLASAQRCPSGSDILHKGLQVILDVHSWESDEAAALAMCQLLHELFVASSAIASPDRFPCAIHLDEAAYWLPQDAVTYLSKETRKAVMDAFHKLASRGRKQGLTPFLYTQSISEVRKETIRQAGIQVLMRQTLDIDVNRYCEYIYGATEKTRAAIRAFGQGKAIVLLPDGSQHRIQFNERQSEHVSHTPQAQAALVKFAAMEIDMTTVPMRDMTTPAPVEQQARSPAGTSAPPGNGKQAPTAKTVTERVHELLAVNPALRVVDLMKVVGCGKTTASKARLAYFERHPQLARPPKTVTEHLYELLSVNPTLRPVDLIRVTGCSEGLAARAHRVYFERHPQLAPIHKTATERIYDLLAEHPTLRAVDLRKRVGCDQALAGRARSAYFAAHPEQQVPAEQGKRPNQSLSGCTTC